MREQSTGLEELFQIQVCSRANNRRDTKDESCGVVGDLSICLEGERAGGYSTGPSTGEPVYLARNSVVHHQFDLRIAEFFRRDDCVEGLISDITAFCQRWRS